MISIKNRVTLSLQISQITIYSGPKARTATKSNSNKASKTLAFNDKRLFESSSLARYMKNLAV